MAIANRQAKCEYYYEEAKHYIEEREYHEERPMAKSGQGEVRGQWLGLALVIGHWPLAISHQRPRGRLL